MSLKRFTKQGISTFKINSSGAINPFLRPTVLDYLVVGGGGGGGYAGTGWNAGGGGAGGLLTGTDFTAVQGISYAITVGSGGTGGSSDAAAPSGGISMISNPTQYSYQFTGSAGSYVGTASSATFNLSSGDWTIEGWYNVTTADASARLITIYPSSGSIFGLVPGTWTNSTAVPNINLFGSSNQLSGGTQTISLNTWAHIALVSSSGTITLYVNGVACGTSSNSWCPNFDTQIEFGGQAAGQTYQYGYPGYISNIRIVMGTAVYTGTFTPPSKAALATSGASSAACYPATTNVNITFPSSNTKFLTAQLSTVVDSSATNNILSASVTPTNTMNPLAINAYGGGGGGASSTAGLGGSGGGAGANNGSNTGGLGTTGQGNNGGANNGYSGGGGGGAGGAGSNGGTSNSIGGNGGIGSTSSFITTTFSATYSVGKVSGTSVYFAGGGGGGVSSGTGGSGGLGGGTAGSGTMGAPVNSSPANTGGGGGGGASSPATNGGSGGSGIVIIRYLDGYNVAASTTGSPIYSVMNGYKTYTFRSSGSITF